MIVMISESKAEMIENSKKSADEILNSALEKIKQLDTSQELQPALARYAEHGQLRQQYQA